MAQPIPIRGPLIKYDGQIIIGVGQSRSSVNWRSNEILWSALVQKLAQPTRTPETMAEYRALPKSQQDEIKDVGGYTKGAVRGGRRRSGSIQQLQLIALDLDWPVPDLWGSIELLYEWACILHSTHSHTPDRPRLRLIMPISRPVTPDEWQAVARRLAADLGIDQFDPTTFEIERLNYWPSIPQDAVYVFEVQDGPWLNPDELLARYDDWKDPSQWPAPEKETSQRNKLAERAEDPHEKRGIVGAFCRTYSIDGAIETFLADVYEPVGDGRYTYKPGSTTGGLVLYDDGKFAYSHHGTDPIGGRLVNAFDLVRIHKFGELDDEAAEGTPVVKLPSYKAMVELAEKDKGVKNQMDRERQAAIQEDFSGADVDPRRLFFDDKDKFIPAFMGEWFLARHHCFILNNELYIYRNGVYVHGERVFFEQATAALGVEFATRRVNEAIAYVKNTVPELTPEEALGDPRYLNVQNGLLDLETFELMPHTPEHRSIIQLPVAFDPDAPGEAYDRFFEQVLPPDAIPLAEEVAGHCLIPSMQYETAVFFIGGGGNGKGTYLQAITTMLGESNVATESLQSLAENRFSAANLFGKMANIHADLPSRALLDSSLFKELVSGDLISAEEKHKPAFRFRNRAKLLFSANEPPVSRDNTHAYHRRILMVPFPNTFSDAELRKRLFEPYELSGLLNKALKGLKRLQKNGTFSTSKSVQEALDKYRKHSDTVYRFLEDCCEFGDWKTPKQEVYQAYRNACLDWGNRPVSQSLFNERLQNLRPEITEYRRESPRRWNGIRIATGDFTS